MNQGYVCRVLWRYSDISSRLCLIVLLWAICGGAFVGIFTSITFVIFLFVYQLKYAQKEDELCNRMEQNQDHITFEISKYEKMKQDLLNSACNSSWDNHHNQNVPVNAMLKLIENVDHLPSFKPFGKKLRYV